MNATFKQDATVADALTFEGRPVTGDVLVASIGRTIKTATGPLLERIAALEQQVKTLQERPGMKYCGLWQDDAKYAEGDVVTHDGSMWCCRIGANCSKPGTPNSGWQLSVKRGKDGRDR